VALETLFKEGGAVNADVQLKFGTIEVDIQKGELRADMKVVAPNSTTSVSGSRGRIRACCSGGRPRWVTFRSFTGTWQHRVLNRGLDFVFSGTGVANNWCDTRRDLFYLSQTSQFMNFFGRTANELYQDSFSIKAGDFNPDFRPMFEFRNPQYFPAAGVFQGPSILPGPPPPPRVP
jgi:hypothetical protein